MGVRIPHPPLRLLSTRDGGLAERQGTALLTRRDDLRGVGEVRLLHPPLRMSGTLLFFDKRRARERRHGSVEERPPVTRKVVGSIPTGVAVDENWDR